MKARRRIGTVSRLDLIGRAVATLVRMVRPKALANRRRAVGLPLARGLPLIGSTLAVARDPRAFFVQEYQRSGPVFRVRTVRRDFVAIAGQDANLFVARSERMHLHTSEPGEVGREGEQGAGKGSDSGKNSLWEHQSRDDAVEKEVVPLDRGADGRCRERPQPHPAPCRRFQIGRSERPWRNRLGEVVGGLAGHGRSSESVLQVQADAVQGDAVGHKPVGHQLARTRAVAPRSGGALVAPPSPAACRPSAALGPRACPFVTRCRPSAELSTFSADPTAQQNREEARDARPQSDNDPTLVDSSTDPYAGRVPLSHTLSPVARTYAATHDEESDTCNQD